MTTVSVGSAEQGKASRWCSDRWHVVLVMDIIESNFQGFFGSWDKVKGVLLQPRVIY